MAAVIVDLLEAVEIDEQQAEHGARQALFSEMLEEHVEPAPVAKAGELVGLHETLRGRELRLRLAQRIERDHEVFVAALEALNELLLARDEIRERAAHEAREQRGLADDEIVERLILDDDERARRKRDRVRDARVIADEERELAENSSAPISLSGMPSPNSSWICPDSTMNMLRPSSPRLKITSPGLSSRRRPTRANSAYSSSESSRGRRNGGASARQTELRCRNRPVLHRWLTPTNLPPGPLSGSDVSVCDRWPHPRKSRCSVGKR